MSGHRLVVLLPFVAACAAEGQSPGGPSLEIAVAALTLPGLTDACYNLKVTNAAGGLGDTVWTETGVCSTQFGDSVGDITYVGTCDAGTNGQVNSVVLSLVDLWNSGTHASAPAGFVAHDTYQNPCGLPSNDDGFPACILEVPCFENQDAQVEFNLTVLRDAGQGFFDIAVNFEDVFCSAKFDCLPTTQNLLFAADQQRHETAVLAFACTAGPGGGPTNLYLDDIVITCGGTTVATLDPSVDDAGDPGPGNQLNPAGTVVDAPDTNVLFQWAVYQGIEQIGVTAVPPFLKNYWNVAIGFDVDDMLGRACTLTTSGTASAGAFTPAGWTPAGAVYPRILWSVPLNGEGASALTCGANELDASSAGPVGTGYVSEPTCFENAGAAVGGDFVTHASACVDDCREPDGPECGPGMACDFLSGDCVPTANACTIDGRPVACGEWECGPGTTCGGTQCQPIQGICTSMVCDVTGLCRGTSCSFISGGVSAVTASAPTTVQAGSQLTLGADVDATALCGLNVAFEVRRDEALYMTHAVQHALYRIPLGGTPAVYLGVNFPYGLVADHAGTLYFVSGGKIYTVPAESQTTPTATVFSNDADAIRLTLGPDGVLYGVTNDARLVRYDASGVETVLANNISTIGGGISFDATGRILIGTGSGGSPATVPVLRYNAGPPGTLETYAQAPAGGNSIPWIEGMSLGPNGHVYMGLFPFTRFGSLLRLDVASDGTPSVVKVVDVFDISASVPNTFGAGIHGIAFGIDGAIYFTNQNHGGGANSQVLKLSGDLPLGTVSLVANIPTLEFNPGYDGDLAMATKTIATDNAPVDENGLATITLPAGLTQAGAYELRVFVTDPSSGLIIRDQTMFTVINP